MDTRQHHSRLGRLLLLPLIACLLAGPVIAQDRNRSLDPGEIYLQGFLLMQDGEKMEKSGDFEGAYRKFKEASDIFDGVAEDYRDYSPQMVNFRRRKIREDVRRVAEKAGIDLSNPPREARSISPNEPSGITRPPGPEGMSVSQRFENLQRRIRELTSERQRIYTQLEGKESDLRSARDSLKRARQMEEHYRVALQKSQEDLEQARDDAELVPRLRAQIDELREQLRQANTSLQEANDRTEAVLAELEKANATIAELKIRQEAFLKEKQQIAAVIRGLDSEESTKQLVEENLSLREQLNAARAQLDNLSQEQEESDAEILKLRRDVSGLRTELARVKKENDDYRLQLEELKGRLHAAMEDQTINPPGPEEAEAMAENVALKRILLRQLKQQTRRQQAKQLVLEELARMEAESTTLITQIENMARESSLADPEKELLAGITGDPAIHEAIDAADQLASITDEDLRERAVRDQKAAAYDFNAGNYEAAELLYSQILQFAPRDIRTICNLGLVKMRLNELPEARKMFEKALVYDEVNAFAHFMLGVADFYLDNEAGSVAAIGHAIRLAPSNADYRHFLGTIHLVSRDFTSAQAELKEVLQLNPGHADAHYNLAVCYLSQSPPSLDEARRHYQFALANGGASDRRMEEALQR